MKYDKLRVQQSISSKYVISEETRAIANRRSRSLQEISAKYFPKIVGAICGDPSLLGMANQTSILNRLMKTSPDRSGNPFAKAFAAKDWNEERD
ncbi:hypothetical protein B0A67_02450 [Flavobacterium aquidurense]|nr:hypothetical protein B0A67_02450 [Flavobacterium aquidurense]